jgi:hypothetical protein
LTDFDEAELTQDGDHLCELQDRNIEHYSADDDVLNAAAAPASRHEDQ